MLFQLQGREASAEAREGLRVVDQRRVSDLNGKNLGVERMLCWMCFGGSCG